MGTTVTTLFLDVGDVLLTKGWGHQSRQLACKKFALDFAELEKRHNVIFPTYEMGKVTLEDYLQFVVFYQQRKFSFEEFVKFMFSQSKSVPKMLELIQKLKSKYRLKIVVVSNEGRELNDYRIQKFKLNEFVDVFITSCYVHLRKPDPDIYHLALDVSHAKREEVVYIDDSELLVEIAKNLGVKSICHRDYASTKEELALCGLV